MKVYDVGGDLMVAFQGGYLIGGLRGGIAAVAPLIRAAERERCAEATLLLMEKIVSVQTAFDEMNTLSRALFGDFAPTFSPLPDCIANEVVALADAVLGDDLASYFLYECQRAPVIGGGEAGGSITLADGRQFPICTVSDVRAYLAAIRAMPDDA